MTTQRKSMSNGAHNCVFMLERKCWPRDLWGRITVIKSEFKAYQCLTGFLSQNPNSYDTRGKYGQCSAFRSLKRAYNILCYIVH